MKEIILASQSPRRKELLEEVGLRFRVEPAQIEEHLDESLPITQAIEQLAKEKAMPIARRHPQCIVIAGEARRHRPRRRYCGNIGWRCVGQAGG